MSDPITDVVTLIGTDVGTLRKQNTYTHIQSASSSSWVINHGMGKFPSVSVVDSAGSEVVGDVVHGDINTVIVNFSAPFQGRAFLN